MFASLFPWILYLIAWIFTGYYFYSDSYPFWETLLFYVILLNGGIQGLWAAVGHLIFPKQTAEKIGWQPCGFQTEMGGANLAIGIVSILCFWYRDWIVPVGLMIAILFSVCAFQHIRDRIVNKNNAPCNSGPMMYNTIIVVMTILLAIALK